MMYAANNGANATFNIQAAKLNWGYAPTPWGANGQPVNSQFNMDPRFSSNQLLSQLASLLTQLTQVLNARQAAAEGTSVDGSSKTGFETLNTPAERKAYSDGYRGGYSDGYADRDLNGAGRKRGAHSHGAQGSHGAHGTHGHAGANTTPTTDTKPSSQNFFNWFQSAVGDLNKDGVTNSSDVKAWLDGDQTVKTPWSKGSALEDC